MIDREERMQELNFLEIRRMEGPSDVANFTNNHIAAYLSILFVVALTETLYISISIILTNFFLHKRVE